MTEPVDWTRVHARMLELEDEHGGDHAPIGVVIARLLDVEHDERFDAHLDVEIERAWALGQDWYSPLGVEPTIPNVLAVGLLQGVTLAAAIAKPVG